MRKYEPSHSEAEVRDAVDHSLNLTEALRRLGLRTGGGNRLTLKKLIAHYGISTEHFDPVAGLRTPTPSQRPLREVLVEGSTYGRTLLKARLYAAGLKERRCELCGQGEEWNGRLMSLILDHINGVGDDNRLENLQIVCPNCAATLDTHCGRKNRINRTAQPCELCGQEFIPSNSTQRYCSRACGIHSPGPRHPHPERRKVKRPPYEQLMAELEATNYSAVARTYGVSDNAVRKWVRWYRARTGEDSETARSGVRSDGAVTGERPAPETP